MSKFIWLTKVEYDEVQKNFEESSVLVNVDAIAYVESRVMVLKNGDTILCKESDNHIVALITE